MFCILACLGRCVKRGLEAPLFHVNSTGASSQIKSRPISFLIVPLGSEIYLGEYQ